MSMAPAAMIPVSRHSTLRGREEPSRETALSSLGQSRQKASGRVMNTAMRASNLSPMYSAWGICPFSVMSGRRKYKSASLAAKNSAVFTRMNRAMSTMG